MTAAVVRPDLVTQDVTQVAAAVARQPLRRSWSLSPTGDYGACVVTNAHGASLEVHHRGRVRSVSVPTISPFSQLVVDDVGSVLLCRHRYDAHLVQRVGIDGRLTTICRAYGGGFWLARIPDRLIAVHTIAGRSKLLALTTGGLRALADIPLTVIDVVAVTYGRLAVTVKANGGTHALDVELDSGTTTSLFAISADSDEAVLDYLPQAQTVVVATTATGTRRLGIGPLDGRISFPDALIGVDYLAASADGRLLAVARDNGTSHSVAIVNTTDWTAKPARPAVQGPFVVYPRAALTDTGLTAIVVTTSGSRPMRMLTDTETVDSAQQTSVREETIHGVPCIVYGNPQTATNVVIALHGGPASAWRIGDDPLIAGLTAVGAAVVAVNVRGSTGYGREYQSSTIGHWGGPDSEDVHTVAKTLIAGRGPDAGRPLLLGCSYGAWLALVTAGARPDLFTGVAALSPFISGAALVADGGAQAILVSRLRGQNSPDAREACKSLTLPVLILHGDKDEVIPVEHSRELATYLAERGVTVRHLEVAGAGHDLLAAPTLERVLSSVLRFVAAEAPERP